MRAEEKHPSAHSPQPHVVPTSRLAGRVISSPAMLFPWAPRDAHPLAQQPEPLSPFIPTGFSILIPLPSHKSLTAGSC